jgi:ubiquinone/menaquinone biosynthesis C-methylase UbiE
MKGIKMTKADKGNYDSERIKNTFEKFDEWGRFEGPGYNKFVLELHMREIQRHVKKGQTVLDLGSGPGRFSIEMLKLGAKVTLVDISPKQLSIAQRKIKRAKLEKNVEGYYALDATNMPEIEGSQYDLVVAYGGLLSFVADKRHDAIKEIYRILKPRGYLLAEVMCRYGVFREVLVEAPEMFKEPEENNFWEVLETGEQPWRKFWALHFYTADEFRDFLTDNKFAVKELFSMPSIFYAHKEPFTKIIRSKKAMETVYRIEEYVRDKPGMIDAGQYLIAYAKKK